MKLTMNAKTARIAGLGIVSAALAGYMLIDTLSASNTAPIVSDDPIDFMAAAQETPTEIAPITAPSPIEPVATEVLMPTPMIDTPLTSKTVQNTAKVTHEPTPNAPITFTLPERTQEILSALEQTYLSEVNLAKLTAQLAEKKQSDEYDRLTTPPIEVIPPPTSHTVDTLSLIAVKSIVVTPTRATAWVELHGQTVPVERGSTLDDVKVLRITKDAVQLMDKRGRDATKFVETVTKEGTHGLSS